MGRDIKVFTGNEHYFGYKFGWCLKHRRPILADPAGNQCKVLIRAKSCGHRRRIITSEIMPGHMHLLVKAHLEHSPSYTANQFKNCTSHALCAGFGHLRSRLLVPWSKSYFAATAGAVPAAVRRYINTQCERPSCTERAR